MNEEQGVIYLDEVEDKRVVLLQSGGLDSNVLASLFKDCGFEMHHIFVDYGQNMKEKELEYARKIAEYYGGTLSEVKLELPWLKETTCLVDNVVNDSGAFDSLNAIEHGTYVPEAFRNRKGGRLSRCSAGSPTAASPGGWRESFPTGCRSSLLCEWRSHSAGNPSVFPPPSGPIPPGFSPGVR